MFRRLVPASLGAVALVLSVGVPAAAARPQRAPVRPDPVLLVHGFEGSASGWHAMTAYLRAHGYRAAEIDALDYDSDASNVDTARRIAREAAALRARPNDELDGAHNVETRCLGHSSLKADPAVLGQVARFLARPTVGG